MKYLLFTIYMDWDFWKRDLRQCPVLSPHYPPHHISLDFLELWMRFEGHSLHFLGMKNDFLMVLFPLVYKFSITTALSGARLAAVDWIMDRLWSAHHYSVVIVVEDDGNVGPLNTMTSNWSTRWPMMDTFFYKKIIH